VASSRSSARFGGQVGEHDLKAAESVVCGQFAVEEERRIGVATPSAAVRPPSRTSIDRETIVVK
jgi:hypothetical protein